MLRVDLSESDGKPLKAQKNAVLTWWRLYTCIELKSVNIGESLFENAQSTMNSSPLLQVDHLAKAQGLRLVQSQLAFQKGCSAK